MNQNSDLIINYKWGGNFIRENRAEHRKNEQNELFF